MKNPIRDGSKIGDIRIWTPIPLIKTDEGWTEADGRMVSKNKNPVLFSLIGYSYGPQDKDLFALPNLIELRYTDRD